MGIRDLLDFAFPGTMVRLASAEDGSYYTCFGKSEVPADIWVAYALHVNHEVLTKPIAEFEIKENVMIIYLHD